MKTQISFWALCIAISFFTTRVYGQHYSIATSGSWASFNGGTNGTTPATGWNSSTNFTLGNGWQNSSHVGQASDNNNANGTCEASGPGTLPSGSPSNDNPGYGIWYSNTTENNQVVYLRYVFNLPSLDNTCITNVQLFANADDNEIIYLNGHILSYVQDDGPIEQDLSSAALTSLVTGELQSGENVIAIMAENTTPDCAIAIASLNFDITTLPTLSMSQMPVVENGDQVTFTYTACNSGTIPINAVISDQLNPGLTIISTNTFTVDGNRISKNVVIPAGGCVSESFTATTNFTFPNYSSCTSQSISVPGVATLTGDNCTPVTYNYAYAVYHNSIPEPTITKTANTTYVDNGGNVEFTFQVCNTGPPIASALIVDHIDPNLTVNNNPDNFGVISVSNGDFVLKSLPIPAGTNAQPSCVTETFEAYTHWPLSQCTPQTVNFVNCATVMDQAATEGCIANPSCVEVTVATPPPTNPTVSLSTGGRLVNNGLPRVFIGSYAACTEFTEEVCITNNGSYPLTSLIASYDIPAGFSIAPGYNLQYSFTGTVYNQSVSQSITDLPANSYGTLFGAHFVDFDFLLSSIGPFPYGLNDGDEVCVYIPLIYMGCGSPEFPGFTVNFSGTNGCNNQSEEAAYNVRPLHPHGPNNCVPLSADLSATPACTGNIQSVASILTAIVTGPGGPYEYNWSNGLVPNSSTSTTEVVDGVSASGNYVVTVTETGGCTATASANVDDVALDIAITGTSNICAGSSTTLTANSPAGTTGYIWFGTNDETPTLTVTPPSNPNPTKYTVMAGIDPGCLSTASIEVNVVTATINPSVASTCSGGTTEANCLPFTVAVSGYSSGTPTYVWSNGSTDETTNICGDWNSNTTITTPVNCTISVGNCTETVTAKEIIKPLPDFPLNDTGQSPENVSTCYTYGAPIGLFVLGGIGMAGATYHWSTGATTSSITVYPTVSTDYSVTVTNIWGCSSSESENVNICPSSYGLLFSPPPQNACADTPVTFVFDSINAGGGPGDSVEWSFNLGFNPSTIIPAPANIEVTVPPDSSDTIYVRRISIDTGHVVYSDTSYTVGTVITTYTPPVAPAPQSACSNTSVLFTFDSIGSPGCGGDSIEWSLNSNFSGAQILAAPANIQLLVDTNTSDTIWIRRINSAGGVLSAAVYTVATVITPSAPPVAPAPQSMCSDSTYTFTFGPIVASNCGGDSIEWSLSSNFATYYTQGSPAYISVTVPPGSTDTIWIRSSSGGEVSSTVYTTATVNAILNPPVAPTPQTVCSDSPGLFTDTVYANGCGANGIEWSLYSDFSSFQIAASPAIIQETVQPGDTDTVWIRSVNLLTLNTSSAVFTTYTVNSQLGPPSVSGPQAIYCANSPVVFDFNAAASGCGGNQVQWSLNSNFASCQTVSSPAVISVTVMPEDTDTIWVRSENMVTGQFGSAVYTTAIVSSLPQPPTTPAAQFACGNGPAIFTFTGLSAGCGGNMIQWDTDSTFDSLLVNVAASPATITVEVPPNTVENVWFRSFNSVTGTVSAAVYTNLTNMSEAGFSINPMITNYNCSSDTGGSIYVSVSGGVSPYVFAWNNGDSIQTPSGLTAGSYEVSVTDSSGCVDTASATVLCTGPCNLGNLSLNCQLCLPQNSGSINYFISFSFAYPGNYGSQLFARALHTNIVGGYPQNPGIISQGINKCFIILNSPQGQAYSYDTIQISVVNLQTGDTCTGNLVINLSCDSNATLPTCTNGAFNAIFQQEIYLGSDSPGTYNYMLVAQLVNNTSGIIQAGIAAATGNNLTQVNEVDGGIHLPGTSLDTTYFTTTSPLTDSICFSYLSTDTNFCPSCQVVLCASQPCQVPNGFFEVTPDTACEGDSVKLTFGGGLYYRFITDGAFVSPAIVDASPTITSMQPNTLAAGNHIMQVIMSFDSGFACADTVTQYVTSVNCCQGQFNFPDSIFCVGDTICFSVLGGDSFQLFVDTFNMANLVGSGTTPMYNCNPASGAPNGKYGYHTAYVVIYSSSGCTDTISRVAYIRPLCACGVSADSCPALTARFNYTLYPGYVVLRDQSLGNPTFVEWYVGNQTYVTGPGDSLVYSFVHSGSFTVCEAIHYLIYGSDQCCIKDTCVTINGSVDTCSILGLTADFSYNNTSPFSYNFHPMWPNNQAPSVIIWNFGDSTSLYADSTTQVTHTYDSSGYYDVCVNEIWLLPGNYCCIDSQCYEVVVEPMEMKVQATPNPFAEKVTFRFQIVTAGYIDLALYDILGNKVAQLISSTYYKPGYYSDDFILGNLSNNVYNYRFSSSDGVFAGKIVKQ